MQGLHIQFKGISASGYSLTEEQTKTSVLHPKETHREAAPSVSLGNVWLSLENCFTSS